jgi:hypothetical protein
MRKSSRFWWLHGAILMAAVTGCRSCKDGTCGGPGQGAGPTGLTGSTSANMYQQGTGGYPGMSSSGMPSGAMSSGGMPAGQSSYAPSGGASYPAPGLSSGLGAPH